MVVADPTVKKVLDDLRKNGGGYKDSRAKLEWCNRLEDLE